METRKNYGYLINDSKLLSQVQYDTIKGDICQICTSVEYALQNQKEVPNFTISFPLNTSRTKQGVVHVFNKTTYFYLYDNHMLRSNSSYKDLTYFFNTNLGPMIAKRCFNFTKLLLNGSVTQEQIADKEVIRLIKEKEQLLSKLQSKTIKQADLHNYAQTYFNDELYSLTIASNPKTHPKTLYALAHSPFTDVKIEVAKNPNATAQILNHLLSVPEAVPYVMSHPNYLNAPPALTM